MGVTINGKEIPVANWDDTSVTGVIYLCFSAPNVNAANRTQCVIEKVDTNNKTIEYSGGKFDFINRWIDRLLLDYSPLTEM